MTKDGVVVDANVIKIFIEEEMKDSGDIYVLINILLDSTGLAINEMIEHEWVNVTGNQFFKEWFTINVLSEKIRFVDNSFKLTGEHSKKINITYGLPKGSRDIEYIKCAINTMLKYILTEDIDFFDPKKKAAPAKEKYAIKNQRLGRFCKFLNKDLGITVGLPEHCCNDLKDIGVIV